MFKENGNSETIVNIPIRVEINDDGPIMKTATKPATDPQLMIKKYFHVQTLRPRATQQTVSWLKQNDEAEPKLSPKEEVANHAS